MTDSEQDRRNRELVEALRRSLDVPMKRLTPEVEPATVYSPSEPLAENDNRRD